MARPKSSTSASHNLDHQLSFRPSKEVISSEERQGLEDCIAALKKQLAEKDQQNQELQRKLEKSEDSKNKLSDIKQTLLQVEQKVQGLKMQIQDRDRDIEQLSKSKETLKMKNQKY